MRKRKRRKKDALDRLYDSFLIKDLSRREFRKQYLALTNQTGINRDLRAAVKNRQAVHTMGLLAKERKLEIDRSLR